jgi:hypothetical protein
MGTEATALARERVLRTRLNKDGYSRTDNPDYKAEYDASDKPWRVIQRLWISYSQHAGSTEPSMHRDGIARCYDPRKGQWVYRRVVRDPGTGEWVFIKPPPAHFETLAAAKEAAWIGCPFNRYRRPTDWVRDDD